ncbi:hypothetical protein HXX76_005288 [Chlamydomonas incerta]|uniref:Serine/threonine-protein kinase n=1 Tax=Chlamydomonas incerta TaxID=51695 RepID=A0A835T4Q7_CHLIN|nr:hypothetical protein HXX76_005288 [Chlamydomonas incerta]|eukprot:KAG2438743.1 hypothetical protein HXX76_005288 [Chlamydomonas incerta]
MGNSLHKACSEKDLTRVRILVQQNPGHINQQEKEMGWTPLHIAAFKGSDPIVRELLARGARHDITDKEGRTALHLAALNGFSAVVTDLMRRGASAAARDKNGKVPYDYAVQKHPAVAALLGGPPPPQPAAPAAAGDWGGTASPTAAGGAPPPAPQPQASGRLASGPGGSQHDMFAGAHAPAAQPGLAPTYAVSPTAAATGAPSYGYAYGAGAYGSAPPLPTAAVAAAYAYPPRPPPHQAPGAAAAPPPQPQPQVQPQPYYQYPSAAASGSAGGASAAASHPPPTQPTAPSVPAASAHGGPPLHGREGSSSHIAPPPAPAADLDWGPPAPSDWGDEPDTAAAPPPPRRPGFNPIMSARFQLEKLLGAGLAQLGIHSGGGAGNGQWGQGGGSAHGSASASQPLHQGHPHPHHAGPSPLGPLGGGGGVLSTGSTASASSISMAGRTYSYEDLRAATGGFSPINKLGEGGYGPVYRGTLDGIPVAVKVMDCSEGAMQGRNEFEAEVRILSGLHHPHVVLLIGSCPDKGILVYELMPNGSLETHLFGWEGGRSAGAGGARGPVPLGWRHRVRIAAEVASALLFLHSAPTPIVHMDLKPANILLDEHLTAKLGDVGLARLAPTLGAPSGPAAAAAAAAGGVKSTIKDSRLVGTFEYMDPEYMRTGEYSAKSDVYALGMVLLQLLTGREGAQVVSVVESARRQPLGFGPCIDPRAGDWPAAEAMAFADLALRCVEYRRQDRPDLRTVLLPTLIQLKQRTQLYEQQQQPAASSPSQADAVPPMFLCPITQDVMEDPVVAADGYTYERLAITEWVSRSPTSPLTNMRLDHTQVVPNLTLRSAIKEWREQQQHPRRSGPGAVVGPVVGPGAGGADGAPSAPPMPSAPPVPARADAGGW